MKSLAQGSTRYNLSKVALLKSPLRLPKHPEQTAIAAVLSEMDGELAVLKQRREKTRALKQAKMQELLTGRKRLGAHPSFENLSADTTLTNLLDFNAETQRCGGMSFLLFSISNL